MTPNGKSILDFSSQSFERFQDAIRAASFRNPWLWLLRDGIFGTLHHDPLTVKRVIRTKDALLLLPGGWIIWLLLHKILLITGKVPRLPEPTDACCHLLFLSTRSNHIKRVLPLMRELSEQSTCVGWATHPKIFPLIDAPLRERTQLADQFWIRTLRVSDMFAAASCGDDLRRYYPGSVPWLQRGKVRIYVAVFLAWKRFWQKQFRIRPDFVLTTYEKDPMAKAMLYIAAQLKVPRRVHWAHGLRHASLQSTFATELWCPTENDPLYYQDKLPCDCKSTFIMNPASKEMLELTGKLDESDLIGAETIHFLFLGNGIDSAYTDEMRSSDMKIILLAMNELGSKVKWRFRPHPGAVTKFRDTLDSLGFHNIDFSTRELNEDLKWAHAVGASFSSVLVDISQTGRKIFWVQETIRPLYGVDELIREGYGTHVDSSTVVQRIRDVFGLKTT